MRSIIAAAVVAILSSFVVAEPAGICGGAYWVDLVAAPANCTRQTQKNDTITVDYKGYFPNGTVFDQSFNSTDGPLVFQYGIGQVIKGFDQGLVNMCVGERRWIMIPPEFGYGNRTVGDGLIPPNSTLLFEVLLEDIKGGYAVTKRSMIPTRSLRRSMLWGLL